MDNGSWLAREPIPRFYTYDEIGPLVVSPDNQAVMYAVRTGNRWNIIRYAEIVFPEGAAELPVFGADGRERHRLKNVPKIKRPPLEQALAQQPFDAVGGYGFLADGTFVYTARRGTQWSLVRGDTIDGPYESLDAPLFNAKMNQVLCKAKLDGQWYLLAGAKKYGPYEAMGAVTFSPKGDHVVYSAKKAGQWCVSVDGVDGEGFTAVEAPIWSPDGTQMSYVAKKGGQYGVVQDGKLGALYDAVSQLSFSRSGRQVAFAAQSAGKWRVLVGNAAGAPYDMILDRSIVVDQEGGQPQTTQMGTVYAPLTFHYLAARPSTKKINNEEAFDVYSVKETRFE